MAGKQEYNQICPVASALDVIGSRWALLVLRELELGPRRFGDIHAGLETASTDMVTSRLRELEAAGLIQRTVDKRYQVTPAGLALGPVMRSMMIWSMQTDAIAGTGADGSPRSFGPHPVRRVLGLLSLMTRTTPPADTRGKNETVLLQCDGFVTAVTRGPVSYRIRDVAENGAISTAGTITISTDALLGVVVGGAPVQPLMDSGQVNADSPAARRVLKHLTTALATVHEEVAQPVS